VEPPKNVVVKKTKLMRAMDDKESVTLKILTQGMAKLELTTENRETLAETLAKSIFVKSLTLADLVKAVTEKKSSEEAALVITEVLQFLKSKKNEKTLKTIVENSKLDLMPIIAAGLDGEALTDLLTSKDLLCLAPVPDLSKDLSKMLKDGKGDAEVLATINSNFDSKQSAASLAPALTEFVLGKVLKDPSTPDVSAIKDHADLLKRALCEPKPDLEAMKGSLLLATAKWAAAKQVKGVIKTIFQALHEHVGIAPEAFEAWRKDGSKTPGKMKALLQCNSWVESILPKPEQEEDEGDEGDYDDDYSDGY